MNRPVPNPAPPAPKDRPVCPWCMKPRRPRIEEVIDWSVMPPESRSRAWNGRYSGYGHFCSLRCASAFANYTIDRDYVDPDAFVLAFRRSA